MQRALDKGAVVVEKPTEIKDDDGVVRYCVNATYGDTTHTLIDRSKYKGQYLPGYKAVDKDSDPIPKLL